MWKHIQEPVLGEIRQAKEIGKKKYLYHRYMWCACGVCGVERWVKFERKVSKIRRCNKCAHAIRGEQHPLWRGGKRKEANGYTDILLSSDSPFKPTAHSNGYIPEHRLVVAQHLSRLLQPWEIVHHKNGIKDDNRIENLELLSQYKHRQIEFLVKEVKRLQQRVTLLEAQNVLLEEQFQLEHSQERQ